MTDYSKIVAGNLADYLRDLEMLVNLDCGTHLKPGVDAVAQLMRERFREFGAEVVDYPQEQHGNMVYGRWRGTGAARIIMIGHMDTVFPAGTIKQSMFRRVGSRLMGPGVADMKSGLLAGLYAMRALAQGGFDQFAEIGLFCNSEEEIGSPASRDLYAAHARNADAALILESARASGAMVSARKGVGEYKLVVRGKSAHAGVEPEKGAHAILALANYIIELQKLNGSMPGLTVNTGVIDGGTKSNVVPDAAHAEIDVRILRASDAAPLEQAMREIVQREFVAGTRAEISGSIKNPPMEKSAATTRLVALAQNAARELGLEVQDVATGGGSDGNYTASMGVPTLDGLGPVGGNGHNAQEEWTDAESIVPRTAMLAKLLIAIASEKK